MNCIYNQMQRIYILKCEKDIVYNGDVPEKIYLKNQKDLIF